MFLCLKLPFGSFLLYILIQNPVPLLVLKFDKSKYRQRNKRSSLNRTTTFHNFPPSTVSTERTIRDAQKAPQDVRRPRRSRAGTHSSRSCDAEWPIISTYR